MKKSQLFLVLCLCIPFFANSKESPPFIKYLNDPWVNSTLQKMTLDEKIGQLFIVQAYSNKPEEYTASVLSDIRKYKVGGVLFMQGHPTTQANMTNRIQEASKIPLLVAMDAEWGLGFRLDSVMKYPVQMALGAIGNDSLIYQMGKEIGEQCRRLGVNINFAPVADINSNPENPVIGYRSFGEDKQNVARKAWSYASGMQNAGTLACAKHFPGHGDTGSDSHFTLPVVSGSEDYLDSVNLVPFRFLAGKGIAAMMTAHLQVPAIEPDKRVPSSLSEKIIQKKLVGELNFAGLIITDAMNMKGVSKLYSPGEAAVKALKAGNDMIEITPDLNEAILAVKNAIRNGTLTEEMINKKCRKILSAKKWLGLDHYIPVKTKNLYQDLNRKKYMVTHRKLHLSSLTVLINTNSLLPLKNLDTLKIATLSIGTADETPFQQMLGNYMAMDHFVLPDNSSPEKIATTLNQLKPYNLIIAGIHGMKLGPSDNFGLTQSQFEVIRKLDLSKSVVCLFGNPYSLSLLPEIQRAKALIIGYQENKMVQELSAQLIFGAVGTNAKLPVNVNSRFRMNDGFPVKKIGRLAYSFPENTGIRSDLLSQKIDSLALLGLKEKAYPGCQVLIAKNGEVIFHKCYGYYTFDSITPVQKDNLYDWASLTKITGPLPAIMKLTSEGKINLDKPFSDYWTDFKGSDKANITWREILAHQGGFVPYLSYCYSMAKKNGKSRASVFKDHPTNKFCVRVSSNLYENKNCIQSIYQEIKESKLLPKRKYVYSGLCFFIFPAVIEQLTGDNYEHYLKANFYAPLGAGTITYNPYKYFPIQDIIPTEDDTYFRKELLQGFVHDEGAAMMGGISGNAGLFGSANDLAKEMQMYLQYGWYGGEQFIDSATVKEFIRRQYPKNENRRGLGFDKPYIDNHKNKLKDAYPAVDASDNSFGHSGFTGTFTWADPDNQLLFIFFSNRVYPTRENSKLFDLNLRPQMYQAIYDCIKTGL